jgi:hypothetical protein
MAAKILASCLLLVAAAMAEKSVRLAAGMLKGEVIQMARKQRSPTLAQDHRSKQGP